MLSHHDVFSQTRTLPERAVRPVLFDLLALWRQRARTRHQLAGLDDRQLRDIGVDRVMAHNEATKPFWRP